MNQPVSLKIESQIDTETKTVQLVLLGDVDVTAGTVWLEPLFWIRRAT